MPTDQNGTYVNNGAAVEDMHGDHLTPAERRRLQKEALGTPFDPFERLFASFDGGTAFAYSEFDAYEYRAMLERDGQACKLEQVLTLPIRGANWAISPDDGDTGQAEFVEANLADKLGLIIDQMTSAVTYRRAFFETSWTTDPTGRLVYSEVALRPATGCEPGFNPQTGAPKGFRQRIVPVAGIWPKGDRLGTKNDDPGWVTVKPNRAFVYVHGIHRDPVNGLSDLRAAHWAYTTKQKVMFLWFQYLEQQSLPKMLIYGDDETQASERANIVRNLKSSGVAGMERPNEPNQRSYEILESAGHGASQFTSAIAYLDSMMSASTLASFTDLGVAGGTSSSGMGGSVGSYALSADQSEFFLNARQSVADEMADAIRRDLFGPLVAFNFGVNASVPKIRIGPISKKQGEQAMTLLSSIITAVNLNVPHDFVDQLAVMCAGAVGLNETELRDAIARDATTREQQAALQAEANKAQAQQMIAEANQAQTQGPAAAATAPVNPAAPPPVSNRAHTISPRPATNAAALANVVDTAFELAMSKRGGRT